MRKIQTQYQTIDFIETKIKQVLHWYDTGKISYGEYLVLIKLVTQGEAK